ncbi:MAG TPA: hypothetical protein PLA19_01935 [Candidatus Pacearchaeota archaeon]|nr:hypothetical protein [Candidatus Pacearchaeota archaeon]
MLNFYSLQPSTRMFIVGLVASFLYLFEIDLRSIDSIVMVRVASLINLIFVLMGPVSIFTLVVGSYRGVKEIRQQIKHPSSIGLKSFYRLAIVLGIVLFFWGLFALINYPLESNFKSRTLFFVVFLYIFFARFVWKVFNYIVTSPQKDENGK